MTLPSRNAQHRTDDVAPAIDLVHVRDDNIYGDGYPGYGAAYVRGEIMLVLPLHAHTEVPDFMFSRRVTLPAKRYRQVWQRLFSDPHPGRSF